MAPSFRKKSTASSPQRISGFQTVQRLSNNNNQTNITPHKLPLAADNQIREHNNYRNNRRIVCIISNNKHNYTRNCTDMRDDTSSTAATGAAAAAAAATSSSIAGICMVQVKRDIYRGIVECAGRGLMHGAKWLAELNHGIDMTVASGPRTAESGTSGATATATTAPATSTATTKPAGAVSQPLLTDADRAPPLSGVASLEADAYYMAKSFFDCREYSRSAHFTRNCQSPLPHFLHLYATYMAREKRRLDSLTDSSNLHQPATNTKDVTDLVHELRALHAARKLDGYGTCGRWRMTVVWSFL